jgi:hypothetical protein
MKFYMKRTGFGHDVDVSVQGDFSSIDNVFCCCIDELSKFLEVDLRKRLESGSLYKVTIPGKASIRKVKE